jgi:Type II secretion system (T2SS), protein F
MTAYAVLPWLLGAAWGAVLALPIARHATRVELAARMARLSVRPRVPRRRRAVPSRLASWWRAHSDGVLPRVLRSLRARGRDRDTDVGIACDLPVALDLLGVAVGAGCTPYLAIEVAACWSAPPIAVALHDVLRSCSLGLDLESALDTTVRTMPRLRPLADALLVTDRLGVPVGPVLARLAEEDRTALRRAAEAHARRIPVRLLFPLVFLVLPAFVLLTVVPGLAAGLGRL